MNSIITEPVTYTVESSTADKLRSWLDTRGGVAVWQNCDLGSPSIGCPAYTPADSASPHWQYGNKPIEVVTDRARFQVRTLREVARVKVRRGPPCYGGINRADRAKLDRALDSAGDGAVYCEDYSRMAYGSAWFEAVVSVPASVTPL